jgi:pyruvate formate-lyase activating enzyme-like uncharacterized protein
MQKKESIKSADETRVTGLFDDSEQAKEAVEELKDAGFGEDRIAIAMQDSAAQDSFIAKTKVLTAAAEETPSIPELDSGQVLVFVEAADQAALALEIINRNQGVTGGVRMPT